MDKDLEWSELCVKVFGQFIFFINFGYNPIL